MRAFLVIVGLVLSTPVLHAAEVALHLGDVEVRGEILAQDADAFTFRVAETGDEVRLQWSDLPADERQRLQRGNRRNAAEEITVKVGNMDLTGTFVGDLGDQFQLRLSDTGDVVALPWSSLPEHEARRLRRQLRGDPASMAVQVTLGDFPVSGELVRASEQEFELYLPDTGDVVPVRWDEIPADERERVRELAACLDEIGAPVSSTVMFALGDMIVKGEMKQADSRGFTVSLSGTGDSVYLPWSDLPEAERLRLQGQWNVRPDAADSATADKGNGSQQTRRYRGRKVRGVEVVLKGGSQPLIGMEVRERSTHDSLFLKSARVSGVRVPRKMIRKTRPVMLHEADVYTRYELYERRRAAHPPYSAGDEYGMAQFCRRIGCPEKGLEHLERAVALDPRYAPRVRRMKGALEREIYEARGRELYYEIMRAIGAQSFNRAMRLIDDFKMQFANHPMASRLEEREPALRKLAEHELRREVVRHCYITVRELCRRAAYERIVDGPSVPGRIVKLRDGRTLVGILKSNTANEIVLQEWDGVDHRRGDVEIRIARSQAAHVIPTELNQQRRRRTLQESLDYVSDPEGGIGADMRRIVAARFKVTEDQVRKLWAGRLKRTIRVTASGTSVSTIVCDYSDAGYGRGTWLRDGGGSSGGRRGDDRDPETWWQQQHPQTKMEILRAFAAEAIMDVVQVQNRRCTQCGGAGSTRRYDTRGRAGRDQCPTCMGSGRMVKIIYR